MVSVECLIHLENVQHGAKSVTNVAIKIILVLNAGPSSQEEGIEYPKAHPEDSRAKVSVSSPVEKQPGDQKCIQHGVNLLSRPFR